VAAAGALVERWEDNAAAAASGRYADSMSGERVKSDRQVVAVEFQAAEGDERDRSKAHRGFEFMGAHPFGAHLGRSLEGAREFDGLGGHGYLVSLGFRTARTVLHHL
jgi:hypothetical protein